MPEKGWIGRAWRHADKRMESKAFQELDPQLQYLLRSFVDFHKNKGGLDGTWVTQQMEKAREKVKAGDEQWSDYASYKGIHTQRQIGVIHLGFTEGSTQPQLNAYKYYIEELRNGNETAMQMALVPKAETIVRGVLRLKSLLNQGDKGAALANLTEGLEALERGKDDRALSHFVAFVDGIQNADKYSAAILGEKETQERKNAELEREIHDALEEIERLEQAQGKPIEPAGEESGTVSFDVGIVHHRLSAFRAYLEDKQRDVSDLFNASVHREETMQDFTRRLTELETERNGKREEVLRVRRLMATHALSSSPADIMNLVGQIEKAEDQVKTAESELQGLKLEALEFKKTVVNPAYNRWLRETFTGLTFYIQSCRVVEEIFDEPAWSGDFPRWEALRPEYAKPPALDADDAMSLSVEAETPLDLLQQYQETLRQFPINVLYTKRAYHGNIRQEAVLPSELLRGGVNAYSVLHVIANAQPINWRESVEYHLCTVPRAKKNAPGLVTGIHSGLLEKNILDEDGNVSFDALAIWIQSLV